MIWWLRRIVLYELEFIGEASPHEQLVLPAPVVGTNFLCYQTFVVFVDCYAFH